MALKLMVVGTEQQAKARMCAMYDMIGAALKQGSALVGR